MCPQCNRSELTPRHCKMICEQCGYVESCEDILKADPLAVGEVAR